MVGQSRESLAGVCLVDFQGFRGLPRQHPEVLFPSSIPVTRGRAMHIHRVAFKDSLERPFRTAVWTHISSCLSSSGACPALLSLPLPQSSAPDVQALFGGVAGSFHSGSAGTVCRPQKSIGTRVEGPLQATPLSQQRQLQPIACLPLQRWALSRPMPKYSCSSVAILF